MLKGKTGKFSSMKSIHAGWMNICNPAEKEHGLHHNSMNTESVLKSNIDGLRTRDTRIEGGQWYLKWEFVETLMTLEIKNFTF